MTATVPYASSSRRRRPICRQVLSSFTLGRNARLPALPRMRGRVGRRDACRPHHIHHAGHEAEQQKYNQAPRRDPEHAVERPADAGTEQHPAHELAGKPKPARISRCVSGRWTTTCFGRFVRPLLALSIAETPEPRGKSSLIGTALFQIVAVARVIGHLDATCAPLTIRFPAPSRPRGPYLLGAA